MESALVGGVASHLFYELVHRLEPCHHCQPSSPSLRQSSINNSLTSPAQAMASWLRVHKWRGCIAICKTCRMTWSGAMSTYSFRPPCSACTSAYMHACMCTHERTCACACVCACACKRACALVYVCANVHACVRTCMRACVYECMHTCMHACMQACMRACAHACVHVRMHVCMHVCLRARPWPIAP